MRICVFLSASDLDEKYVVPARQFAELLGRRGHALVWGGSETGLMKVMADGVQEAGGRLVGISVEFLRHVARTRLNTGDEMVNTKTLAERKALLLERADAVVILVGGTGTLDEATEVLELKRHGLHDKPIVFLNTAGYYDGLRQQLERMEREGFLQRPLAQLVHFADDGEDVLRLVEDQLVKRGAVPPPPAEAVVPSVPTVGRG